MKKVAILLVGLLLVPIQASASLVQVTLEWSVTYPTSTTLSPNPFAGTAVFQYDPTDAVDFDPVGEPGLTFIEDIALLSLDPDPLNIGTTAFTASSGNVLASVYFQDGLLDSLSVYGAPEGDNNVVSSTEADFQIFKNINDDAADSIGLRTQGGDSTDFYKTVLRPVPADGTFSLTYQTEPIHDNGVVPEPASVITWCVLSLGLVGIAIRRKK